MKRMVTIDPKAPSEVIPVTFDFARLTTTIDSAIVSIQVKSGLDPGAGSMLFGVYVITGAEVRQLVRQGLDQVIYLLRANIVTGDQQYALACYLPVIELL